MKKQILEIEVPDGKKLFGRMVVLSLMMKILWKVSNPLKMLSNLL